MHVLIHQVNAHIGNLTSNADMIIKRANAGEAGSISIFPELVLCGYPPLDLANMDWFLDDVRSAITKIQNNLRPDILCLFGSIQDSLYTDGKKAQNMCIGISKRKIVHRQAKFLLPSYDVFDEARNFEAARRSSLLAWQGIRIATAICEDIWGEALYLYPYSPMPQILHDKPDLLVVLSSSPYTKHKRAERAAILSHVAKTYGIPICYCNAVGANDGIVFDGLSTIVDTNGQTLAHASACKEARLSARIATKRQTEKRVNSRTAIHDATPVIVLPDIERTEPVPRTPPVLPQKTGSFLHMDICQEVVDVVCLGISDFCKKNGFTRVHLGLSGGIDSALVAVLARIALGADKVHAVLMPSKFNSAESITDAQALSEILGIQSTIVPIHESFTTLIKELDSAFAIGDEISLVHENLQARIRGIILMAYANKHASLLLATGNKSELSVGYCTLYGDMCGGLAVIADLYKTEVYTLYRFLQKNYISLPESIVQKAPSAELRPQQKDQDSLPPYDQLDAMLYACIEERLSAKALLAAGYDYHTVKKVLSLIAGAEFKRYQAPPIVKISPLSFGDGRRIPISTRLHFFEN